MCSYQVLPLDHLPRSAFEFHMVSVTLLFKFNTVVLCLPPGPLCDFFEGMVTLLSCSPDDGTPLVVLGDFNILPEKLHSPEFIDFFSTFVLTFSPLSTHPPTGQTNSTFALSVTPLTVCLTTALSLSLSLKIHHLPHPYTSHSHHPLQSEIPLSFCSLLYCSFLTTIHRPIH